MRKNRAIIMALILFSMAHSAFAEQQDVCLEFHRFPNYFYLPYIARSDTYSELDTIMYDGNNVRLTQAQILDIQAQLNNGNPNPPANGRIENNF